MNITACIEELKAEKQVFRTDWNVIEGTYLELDTTTFPGTTVLYRCWHELPVQITKSEKYGMTFDDLDSDKWEIFTLT
jgi:hypothetical protein